MPSTDPFLARRYRRLLRCYLGDWRRARAAEVITLLLDTAPAGRTRETADLVRGGLRCRLGRPASRTVVTWAALAAVICGLFAGACCWARWPVGWSSAGPADAPRGTG